jgi:hypothetical protein
MATQLPRPHHQVEMIWRGLERVLRGGMRLTWPVRCHELEELDHVGNRQRLTPMTIMFRFSFSSSSCSAPSMPSAVARLGKPHVFSLASTRRLAEACLKIAAYLPRWSSMRFLPRSAKRMNLLEIQRAKFGGVQLCMTLAPYLDQAKDRTEFLFSDSSGVCLRCSDALVPSSGWPA